MKAALILLSGLLLTGCAGHQPNLIALDPQLGPISQQANQQVLHLTVQDLRTANYVVKFDRDKDAAELISPASSPRVQLNALLSKGFREAGYRLSESGQPSVTVELRQLLTKVHESSFSFDADSNILITVISRRGQQTLTQEFRTTGQQSGAFGADFASLELQLNKLLGEIAQAIVQDKDLNQFLTQEA
ncbi:hypothetical protein NFHSH190041_07880 [Shewanella sp. NFH-SH190041]|uniref:YajG family lipoprotein n=1 Tax=Shewanella sp. NFH-SH190041 TaxID=2950245 RepID=UPI0021C48A42|nr:YajG family lipoprotein [Shewanella sp. NFH-SH190041]BDM63336.1 hypothetical protein NFHSH190041_07880 [Shewanella sp. NFH-SH190041]